MPASPIGPSPFPLKVINSDGEITEQEIEEVASDVDGASLCVRAQNGDKNRGGYFFHIKVNESLFGIHDFHGKWIANVSLSFLTKFVNHVSGRKFDPEILVFCQTIVNLKQD